MASNIRGYVMNLDPAVLTLPFGANIDIRDTVRYKEVMKQYNLGPNGGILTSLNLFSTKFDEVGYVLECSGYCESVCFSLFIAFATVVSGTGAIRKNQGNKSDVRLRSADDIYQ